MPVSKKLSIDGELRKRAAEQMQISPEAVFVFRRGFDKYATGQKGSLMMRVWTEGMSDEEVARIIAMKQQIKELARLYGAKIALSSRHPAVKEEEDRNRRAKRGDEYTARKEAAMAQTPGASAAAILARKRANPYTPSRRPSKGKPPSF
jgi:hypothetical protein